MVMYFLEDIFIVSITGIFRKTSQVYVHSEMVFNKSLTYIDFIKIIIVIWTKVWKDKKLI